MIRAFQGATMALRYADVPVVVAPAGLTLGGGCEIALHGDRVQAAAESYIGLVEVGVGLIPGRRRHEGDAGARDGRGCRPARRSAAVRAARVRDDRLRARSRPAPPTRGGSATCATSMRITMNRERLIADAKALRARARARGLPARRRRERRFAVGGEARAGGAQARRPPRVARRTHQRSRRARSAASSRTILAGGDAAASRRRSASSTCSTSSARRSSRVRRAKTLERIQHTLKTGKPLRN